MGFGGKVRHPGLSENRTELVARVLCPGIISAPTGVFQTQTYSTKVQGLTGIHLYKTDGRYRDKNSRCYIPQEYELQPRLL
jgi:hypothetical protein